MPTDEQSGDSSQPHRPEVVCLCGSTRFKDQYREENRRLTMEGKIVLSVGLFGHADDVDLSDDEKEMLDELHKRKIDLADRIHVIDVGGYVGDSTQSEIEYARVTGTKVTRYSKSQQPGEVWDCEEDPGEIGHLSFGSGPKSDPDSPQSGGGR